MFPNERRKRHMIDRISFILALVIWLIVFFPILGAELTLFNIFLSLIVGIIGAFPVMLLLGFFIEKFFTKK
jgi:multisubunit Na+/H+ antiporter MnhE subunit